MTTEEIKALVELQKDIEIVGSDLDRIAKSKRCRVYVVRDGNSYEISVAKIPELNEYLLEVLENYFSNYYDEIVEKKKEIVLCKEGHATNFTPIELIKNDGTSNQ